MAITVKEAQTLYVSYFGRPADFVGLQYWTGTDTIVGSLEQLAHSFYNSAEGKKYFPEDPATQQINIVESINAIYANMFGRVPETAGFDYWYNEIASGKINLAEAAVAIYRGAQGKDALMVENKIAASTQFTDQVAASDKPSLYYGDQAFAKANEFLNTVTDTTDVTSAGFAAQVNAAVNAAEAAGAVAGEGGTFTLTADVSAAGTTATLTDGVNSGFSPTDKFLTNSSDTVNLGAFDVTTAIGKQIMIADASTTDNDLVKFIVSANGAVTATALNKIKLSGIESVEITNDGLVNSGATQTLTLGSNFKGISNLTLKGVGTTVDLTDAVGANVLNITGTSATDTVVVSGGKSVDFSKGTFSSIEIIDISAASAVTKATVAQGTDLTKVMGSGAAGSGDVFTIKKSTVAFNTASEATKEDVDAAGEFFYKTGETTLTYFDEVLNKVVNIGILNNGSGTNITVSGTTVGDLEVTFSGA